MKKVLGFALLMGLVGVAAAQGLAGKGVAQHNEKDEQANFTEHKQKIVERIQKHLDCVKAAQNFEQLKGCRIEHPGHPKG